LTENNRYHFLDSSRGLAAFVVLLAHTIKTFSPTIYQSSFRFVWDSEAAVLFFFILSGFVLAESIRSEKLTINSYFKFAFKRICRIYPVFIVVLILAFLLYPLFDNPISGWLTEYWQNQPTTFDAIKQSILIVRMPNQPAGRILPHDWTLSIEILISLALPFLAWISKRNSWLVLILTYVMVKTMPIDSFIFDFAIGVFISSKKDYLISVWKKINFLGHSLLVIFGLIMLQISLLLPDFSGQIEFLMIHSKSWGISILLIALISSIRFQRMLTNKFLILQGKISYSLYLVHFILIGILFKWHPEINLLPALLLVFTATFLLSAFLYNAVEKPWIQVGKKCFSGTKGQ
jgi:peptidoglycan/LPS O-acetylase OafA/YrhL